jgi:hypothetical protein
MPGGEPPPFDTDMSPLGCDLCEVYMSLTRPIGAPLMAYFYGSRPFGPFDGLETCMVLNVGSMARSTGDLLYGFAPCGPPEGAALSRLVRRLSFGSHLFPYEGYGTPTGPVLQFERPRRSCVDGKVSRRPVYVRPRPVGHAKEPPFRDSPGGSASEAICSLYEGNELILGPRLKS